MVEVLKNVNNNTKKQISKCLSTSRVCGKELREAHYRLGRMMGKQIMLDRPLNKNKISILIMMRSGLPFGLGISDAIEEKNDVAILFSNEENNYSPYDFVIIVDAVINTGKTIIEMIKKLNGKKVIVACNVISSKYLDNLNEYDIFATRISERSFKGEKTTVIFDGNGPDTGDRLFDNSFYK